MAFKVLFTVTDKDGNSIRTKLDRYFYYSEYGTYDPGIVLYDLRQRYREYNNYGRGGLLVKDVVNLYGNEIAFHIDGDLCRHAYVAMHLKAYSEKPIIIYNNGVVGFAKNQHVKTYKYKIIMVNRNYPSFDIAHHEAMKAYNKLTTERPLILPAYRYVREDKD